MLVVSRLIWPTVSAFCSAVDKRYEAVSDVAGPTIVLSTLVHKSRRAAES